MVIISGKKWSHFPEPTPPFSTTSGPMALMFWPLLSRELLASNRGLNGSDETALDQRFNQVEERLDRIEFSINGHDRRLDVLEDKVRQIRVRIGLQPGRCKEERVERKPQSGLNNVLASEETFIIGVLFTQKLSPNARMARK